MRVLMSVPSVLPHHTGGGVAQVNWGVLQELRRRGHEALVVSTRQKEPIPPFQPDVVYSYSVSGFLPPELFPGVPRIGVVGDLDHQVPMYRRQYYARSVPLSYAELVSLHQQAMGIKSHVLGMLHGCQAVICNCYHHSQWLTQMGVTNTYMPNTVADPFHKGWVRPLESYPEHTVPRISMAGHLGGIATLSGLYFLAEDVLPWFKPPAGASWDELQCDVRVAGAEGLFPDVYTRLLPYIGADGPIKLLGYVDDIKAEMMSCEVSLVTTPIDLGVRTRIIDAWALGCCVVTHQANLAGFEPGELVHGVNCLIGSTGREIVDCLKLALSDPALRIRLGQAGRATYEKHHMDAPSKCVDLIESMQRVKESAK